MKCYQNEVLVTGAVTTVISKTNTKTINEGGNEVWQVLKI
jgi:hypothetical protein